MGNLKISQFPKWLFHLNPYLVQFGNMGYVFAEGPPMGHINLVHDMKREYDIFNRLKTKFMKSPTPILYVKMKDPRLPLHTSWNGWKGVYLLRAEKLLLLCFPDPETNAWAYQTIL